MDRSRFGSRSPGRLVPISGGEQAYVPNDPPAALDCSSDTVERLRAAEVALGELRGITTPGVLPSPYVLLFALMRREALRTSSLEGTFVTAEDLLLYELDPRDPKSEESPENAQREVWNFMRALGEGESAVAEKKHLTLVEVRGMHQLLLAGVRGRDKSPGAFRNDQVFIGVDHRFIPPPGHLVPEQMQRLAEYWREPPAGMSPLTWIGVVHYQFETIHPFRDGNGRIGRAILSLMLGAWCGLRRPWLHVSEYFEPDRRREAYCGALFDVSADGDWNRWISLFADAVLEQSGLTIDRCASLVELRAGWIDVIRTAGFKAGAMALVDSLLQRPITDISSAAATMDVTYPTAQKYLESLVDKGLLVQVEGATPRAFMAPQVMRALYADG